MQLSRSTLALLVLVVVGCGRPAPPLRAPRPASVAAVIFERVDVVRMDRDTILRDQTVVVRQGRIERVGGWRETAVPAGARRIDGRGLYLMPGLVDMGVQLSPNSWRIRRELALYVAHGVTTVRNLDGRSAHLRWRERVNRAETVGPRILTCGPPIGSDSSLVGRSDDVLGNRLAALGTSIERLLRDPRSIASIRNEVMTQHRAGYDCIAVDSPSDWTPARYDALVAATRTVGLPLAGDLARNLPLAVNLRGRTTADGLATYLEHVLSPDDYRRATARDSVAREVARAVASTGVALSTRLFAAGATERLTIRRTIGALADAGGRLVLATGSSLRSTGLPGTSVHHELRALVDAGLRPFEALRTATANPAVVLGVPGEFGIVAPGARADLLLLEANPLADVGNTERIAGVMVRGRWYPAAELRQLEADALAPRRLRRWW